VNRRQSIFANSIRGTLKPAPLAAVLLVAVAFAQNPVPQIVGPVKPQAVVPGSGAFTLTVYGANFVSGAVVNWNGQPRATTFVSRRELRAHILASDVAQKTAATISVTNPGPGGGLSSASYSQLEVHEPTTAIYPAPPWVVSTRWAFAYGPVVVADFNGDGKPDMFGDGILMLGKGDGTFHMGWFTKSQYPPFGIVYGDFNGDGKLDLAYMGFDPQNPTNPPKTVRIMLGDGTGRFLQGGLLRDLTGLGFRWLAAGDFNGDGKLDLAVVRGSKLDMYLGNGDGTFRYLGQRLFPGRGLGEIILPSDFNGDGKLDLVTYDQYGDLYILLGKGDGTFRYQAIAVPTMPLYACGPVIVDDFNGDGKLDLAMCRRNLTESQIAVLLGNGDGTFQQPTMYTANPGSPYIVTAGDFDSDGRSDFLVASPASSNPLAVLFGNGDGTFQSPLSVPVVNNYVGEGGMYIGDFNRDGLLDFLAVDAYYEGFVYVQQ
jgi:hypothetical protein